MKKLLLTILTSGFLFSGLCYGALSDFCDGVETIKAPKDSEKRRLNLDEITEKIVRNLNKKLSCLKKSKSNLTKELKEKKVAWNIEKYPQIILLTNQIASFEKAITKKELIKKLLILSQKLKILDEKQALEIKKEIKIIERELKKPPIKFLKQIKAIKYSF